MRRRPARSVIGMAAVAALGAALLLRELAESHSPEARGAGNCFLGLGAEGPLDESRRQALLKMGVRLAAVTAPALALPDLAVGFQEGASEARMARYRGTATSLRRAAEWYRFYIGDLVIKGTGETAIDGMSSDDPDCVSGLCSAGRALIEVRRLLSPGRSRSGMTANSQVEQTMLSPMNVMVDLSVWDPDTVDEAKTQVESFQNSVGGLAALIGSGRSDESAKVVQVYRDSLARLNTFFKTANEASGVIAEETAYLPKLPITEEELASSEYWQVERKAFDEANDPVRVFQESQAFGSRELRQTLKQFPGATLLLR